MFGRTINNSEEKEKSIGDVPSSIGEVITQLTSFYKTDIFDKVWNILNARGDFKAQYDKRWI